MGRVGCAPRVTDERPAAAHGGGELLRRLSSDLQEVGRDFGGRHEMNPSDVRALVLVLDAQRRGVDIGPSALAADLGMSAASVTALVDRLESVGHLRREPDPHDRRRVVLHVGDDAQRLGGNTSGVFNVGSMRQRESSRTVTLALSSGISMRQFLRSRSTWSSLRASRPASAAEAACLGELEQ